MSPVRRRSGRSGVNGIGVDDGFRSRAPFEDDLVVIGVTEDGHGLGPVDPNLAPLVAEPGRGLDGQERLARAAEVRPQAHRSPVEDFGESGSWRGDGPEDLDGQGEVVRNEGPDRVHVGPGAGPAVANRAQPVHLAEITVAGQLAKEFDAGVIAPHVHDVQAIAELRHHVLRVGD